MLFGPFSHYPLQAQTDTTFVILSGALRFNAFYKNWEGQKSNQKQFGVIAFDMARAEVKGYHKGLDFSAQYRFYAGYNMLHHGWIGYNFTDSTHLTLGVNQVPFGIQPYASHSYFFSMAYYVGLEDDYDLGLKLTQGYNNLDFALAFYKNSEGHYSGSSNASARYSYDVVGGHKEVNQVNGRIAYNLDGAEIGLSGEYGQLVNNTTNNFGNHYALAGHLDWDIGRFNIKAEAIHFNKQPADDTLDGTVVMGAYDFPYEVAQKGQMYIGGISYKVPVKWGPITSLTFYENFTYFDKAINRFNDSQMNVAGVMVSAGKLYTYLDVARGQSHPWIGPVWCEALARGFKINENAKDPKPEWSTRYNLNIGYYF
ncbi:MAG: hypothetical protein BRD50_06875, partial [Bacteroidetes bacterium SW_11_45_7]